MTDEPTNHGPDAGRAEAFRLQGAQNRVKLMAAAEPESGNEPGPAEPEPQPEPGPEPDPETWVDSTDLPSPEPEASPPPPPPPPTEPPSMGGPPPPGPPPVRRLVRDPYTRLGGVASGIAHHYGIDVSIVRILFVLAVFASGTGLLAYLLAWLIIPRAEYWPPQGPARSIRSLSGRDLGLVLALGGVAFAIAIGGGAGGILIPLVLVGGGVWLLVQPSPGPEAASAEGYRATGYPPPPDAYAAAPAGAAVPPRSGRRRIVLMTVFGLAIGLLVLLPLGIAGTVAVLIATDTIDFDEPPTITFRPTSVDALPAAIDEDSGRIVIDLTALDTAELADQSERPVIDADVDFGEITVIVPDDLDVTVDADVSLGDVHVFGEHEDGFRPNITRADPDADLDLVLDVGLGEIRVERAAAS